MRAPSNSSIVSSIISSVRPAALPSVLVAGLLLTAATLGSSAADPAPSGSGKAASELRTVAAFESIKLSGAIDLELRIGPQLRVEISADDNLLRYVTTKVKNKTLTVELDRSPGESIRTKAPMRAVITAPSVTAVAVLGSGDAVVSGVTGDQFTMAVSGSGSVRASGTAKRVQAAINGSGEISSKDLTAGSATVAVHGSGTISVHAKDAITAAISGSGDVEVYGKPANVTRIVDGSGEVRLHR